VCDDFGTLLQPEGVDCLLAWFRDPFVADFFWICGLLPLALDSLSCIIILVWRSVSRHCQSQLKLMLWFLALVCFAETRKLILAALGTVVGHP
jgi:hypothetical protein